MNILIIEDNRILAQSLKRSFLSSGFTNMIKILTSYEEFLSQSDISVYDVILVDICLWKICNRKWINILKHVRKINKKIPIIVISSYSEYSSLEEAFQLGANDYIIKPFRNKELQIRIEKWFQNYLFIEYFSSHETLEYWNLYYNLQQKQFYYKDTQILLTKSNRYILLLFLINKEKLVTNEYLVCKIWGESKHNEVNLRVKIVRLKKQLEMLWLESWIQNIRGEGYMLKKDPYS